MTESIVFTMPCPFCAAHFEVCYTYDPGVWRRADGSGEPPSYELDYAGHVCAVAWSDLDLELVDTLALETADNLLRRGSDRGYVG